MAEVTSTMNVGGQFKIGYDIIKTERISYAKAEITMDIFARPDIVNKIWGSVYAKPVFSSSSATFTSSLMLLNPTTPIPDQTYGAYTYPGYTTDRGYRLSKLDYTFGSSNDIPNNKIRVKLILDNISTIQSFKGTLSIDFSVYSGTNRTGFKQMKIEQHSIQKTNPYIITLDYDGGKDSSGQTSTNLEKTHGTNLNIKFPTDISKTGYNIKNQWISSATGESYSSSNNIYTGDTNDTLTLQWEEKPTVFYINLNIKVAIKEFKTSDLKETTTIKTISLNTASGDNEFFSWTGSALRIRSGNKLSSIIITPKNGYDFMYTYNETYKSNGVYYKTSKVNDNKIKAEIYSKNTVTAITDATISLVFSLCKNFAKVQETYSGYEDSDFQRKSWNLLTYDSNTLKSIKPNSKKYKIIYTCEADFSTLDNDITYTEIDAKTINTTINSTIALKTILNNGISYRNKGNTNYFSHKYIHTVTMPSASSSKFARFPEGFSDTLEGSSANGPVDLHGRENIKVNNQTISPKYDSNGYLDLTTITPVFKNNEMELIKTFIYTEGNAYKVFKIDNDGKSYKIDLFNDEEGNRYIYSSKTNDDLAGFYSFYKNSLFATLQLKEYGTKEDGSKIYGPVKIPEHCNEIYEIDIEADYPKYCYNTNDNNDWLEFNRESQQWEKKEE